MKLSHYIYGRKDGGDYNTPGKFSRDYYDSGSDVSYLEGIEGHTREIASYEGGTTELGLACDERAAGGVRTMLCYSEYVQTVDRMENDQLVETSTRAFSYSHYVYPHNAEGDQTLSGREALRAGLELMLWDGLLKDKHAYQQAMAQEGPLRSDDTPQQIPLADVAANYERQRERYLGAMRDVAADMEARGEIKPEKRLSYGPAAFSEDNLGAFMARYWERCWALRQGQNLPALTLLPTSDVRNMKSHPLYDQRNVTRDGVIFMHDQVAPRLPEAVCRIATARFGVPFSGVLAQAEGSRNALIVCFPTEAAYKQKVVYCPFEDAVYDGGLTREMLLLGQAMLRAMPESYLRLEKAGAWQAAANFDTALKMTALQDRCERGLGNAEAAREGAAMLGFIREQLQRDGVTEPALLDDVLYPLELMWANACRRANLPFDVALYTAWVGQLSRLMAENPYWTHGERETLRQAYEELTVRNQGDLNDGALIYMARGRMDATRQAELMLLEQNPYPGQAMAEETAAAILERIGSLRAEGELADRYLAFLTERFAEPLTERAYADCLMMTQARRLSLRSGGKSPEELQRELSEDREQLTRLQRFHQGLAAANDHDLTEALEWYALRRDEELQAPLRAILKPHLTARLGDVSDAQPRRDLIQAYADAMWDDPEIDRLILAGAEQGGDFHSVIGSERLVDCMRAFFSGECHQGRKAELARLLREKLSAAARADLDDLTLIPQWPLEEPQAAELAAELMCHPGALNAQLTDAQLDPLADALADKQSVLTVCEAMNKRLARQMELSPAMAQERAAAYLRFLCRSGLSRADAARLLRGCFDRLLPTQLPEPFLREALRQTIDQYDLSGDSEVTQAVEGWCGRALNDVLRQCPGNRLPDAERAERLSELISLFGGDRERVLLDPIRERCLSRLAEPMDRGEFPLPEAQREVTELLNACGFASETLGRDLEELFESRLLPGLKERRALPDQEDVASLREMYRRFGADEQRAVRSLRAWIAERLEERPDTFDSGFAADFRAATEAASLGVKDFSAGAGRWLTRVTDRELSGRTALPDNAFLEDLKAHCEAMGVDVQTLAPPLREACVRYFGAANWTELPDAALDRTLGQLERDFGVSAGDFGTELKDCARRMIANMSDGCVAEARLPGAEELASTRAFCQRYGLDWERLRAPMENACKRVAEGLSRQQEPLTASFLNRLGQCDETFDVPPIDRAAVLREWMRRTIERADHARLPEGDLLDCMASPRYGEMLGADPVLAEQLMAWLQQDAPGAGEGERAACMKRVSEALRLRCDDERVLRAANSRWGLFFLRQETEALAGDAEGCESPEMLDALCQSDHARQAERLRAALGPIEGAQECLGGLRERLYARLTALRPQWRCESLNAMMRKPWFAERGTLPMAQSALRDGLRQALREDAEALMALSLQTEDLREQVGALRRWRQFAAEEEELRNKPRFEQAARVCERCEVFDRMAADGDWQSRLPDAMRRLSARQDPALDAIGDAYGLQALSELDPVGRKIPILLEHTRAQEGRTQIQWEAFLNKAYPLAGGAAWTNVDLWKSGTGAYPAVSALIDGAQGVPELRDSLMAYLDSSSFGAKAKAKAKTRLRRVNHGDVSQLPPMLRWLLGQDERQE